MRKKFLTLARTESFVFLELAAVRKQDGDHDLGGNGTCVTIICETKQWCVLNGAANMRLVHEEVTGNLSRGVRLVRQVQTSLCNCYDVCNSCQTSENHT
jgi:hypothetical protein